jgi:hypothetical protein
MAAFFQMDVHGPSASRADHAADDRPTICRRPSMTNRHLVCEA